MLWKPVFVRQSFSKKSQYMHLGVLSFISYFKSPSVQSTRMCLCIYSQRVGLKCFLKLFLFAPEATSIDNWRIALRRNFVPTLMLIWIFIRRIRILPFFVWIGGCWESLMFQVTTWNEHSCKMFSVSTSDEICIALWKGKVVRDFNLRRIMIVCRNLHTSMSIFNSKILNSYTFVNHVRW